MNKIIRNIIFICLFITISVLCLTYINTQENIEWYWLGIGISGGIIGIFLAMILLGYTVYILLD